MQPEPVVRSYVVRSGWVPVFFRSIQLDLKTLFGKTHRRNSGPIRNHRPLLWRDQWAHSDASAGLTEEILGPYKIISHFCEEINVPIWMLRQWLWADAVLSTPLLRWAHSELSATLFGNGCGPIQKYQHLCFGGPIQDY